MVRSDVKKFASFIVILLLTRRGKKVKHFVGLPFIVSSDVQSLAVSLFLVMWKSLAEFILG